MYVIMQLCTVHQDKTLSLQVQSFITNLCLLLIINMMLAIDDQILDRHNVPWQCPTVWTISHTVSVPWTSSVMTSAVTLSRWHWYFWPIQEASLWGFDKQIEGKNSECSVIVSGIIYNCCNGYKLIIEPNYKTGICVHRRFCKWS